MCQYTMILIIFVTIYYITNVLARGHTNRLVTNLLYGVRRCRECCQYTMILIILVTMYFDNTHVLVRGHTNRLVTNLLYGVRRCSGVLATDV